jgi:hypothetical protein
MILKTGRVLFFLSLSFFFFLILDWYFTASVPKNTVLKHYWLLNKKNEQYDMAFIGPSRVLNTLDLSVFESELHVNSINLGLSGAGYAELYLMFKSFVEENKNRIKNLYIEISYFNVIDPDSAFSYPFHEYYYFPYIKNAFVYDIIKDNSKNKLKCFAWKYLPFFRYAEFNLNFRSLILFKSEAHDGSVDMGFDKYGSALIDNEMREDVKAMYNNSEMNGKTIHYLERMIELAQKNKMEVTLFTAPCYSKSVSYSKLALHNYKNVVEKITNSYKVNYLDFESNPLLNDKKFFLDKTHLNKKGAVVFSKIFSDTLNLSISRN